jgi:hypothetical protein
LRKTTMRSSLNVTFRKSMRSAKTTFAHSSARGGIENAQRPNGQALSRAARAHVPKPMRRAACLACEARDAAGVTPSRLRRNRRLGRRTEAGPRRLLRRVRPPP